MVQEYIARRYKDGRDEEARIYLKAYLEQPKEPDGERGTATEQEVLEAEKEYYAFRRAYAYGSPAAQMEFITEHGLEAWQSRVADIKAKFPKPVQE